MLSVKNKSVQHILRKFDADLLEICIHQASRRAELN